MPCILLYTVNETDMLCCLLHEEGTIILQSIQCVTTRKFKITYVAHIIIFQGIATLKCSLVLRVSDQISPSRNLISALPLLQTRPNTQEILNNLVTSHMDIDEEERGTQEEPGLLGSIPHQIGRNWGEAVEWALLESFR